MTVSVSAQPVLVKGIERLRPTASPAHPLRRRRGSHARFESGHALLSRHPVDFGLLANTRDEE
jgi:hypothetical protein